MPPPVDEKRLKALLDCLNQAETQMFKCVKRVTTPDADAHARQVGACLSILSRSVRDCYSFYN